MPLPALLCWGWLAATGSCLASEPARLRPGRRHTYIARVVRKRPETPQTRPEWWVEDGPKVEIIRVRVDRVMPDSDTFDVRWSALWPSQ